MNPYAAQAVVEGLQFALNLVYFSVAIGFAVVVYGAAWTMSKALLAGAITGEVLVELTRRILS